MLSHPHPATSSNLDGAYDARVSDAAKLGIGSRRARLDPALSGHKIVAGVSMTIRLRGPVSARWGCNAKLTEAEVLEIFKARGRIAQAALGRKYGVTQGQISQVHRGTSWSWLTRSVKDDDSTAGQT